MSIVKIQNVNILDFLVKNNVAPYGVDKKLKKFFEFLGVEIGNPLEEIRDLKGDYLLCYAKFPMGWHKKETDNNSGVIIWDSKNRSRFSIFPQVSWLGVESVSFWVFPRYDYIILPTDPINNEGEKQGMFGEIRDHAECFGKVFGGKTIHKTRVINLSDKLPTYGDLENVLSKRCERWLTVHYPHWKNPGMYWED